LLYNQFQNKSIAMSKGRVVLMKRLCTFFVLYVILLTACTSAPLEPTTAVSVIEAQAAPLEATATLTPKQSTNTATATTIPTATTTQTPEATQTPEITDSEKAVLDKIDIDAQDFLNNPEAHEVDWSVLQSLVESGRMGDLLRQNSEPLPPTAELMPGLFIANQSVLSALWFHEDSPGEIGNFYANPDKMYYKWRGFLTTEINGETFKVMIQQLISGPGKQGEERFIFYLENNITKEIFLAQADSANRLNLPVTSWTDSSLGISKTQGELYKKYGSNLADVFNQTVSSGSFPKAIERYFLVFQSGPIANQ
jgi:hypothetical protein